MAAVLPIIALVGSLGGAVLSAYGAKKQGDAQAEVYNYNAQVKETQARQELDQSAAKASNDAIKKRQRTAALRAGSIQNGFEVEGSVTDVLRTSEIQGELEGMTALYDGTVRAQSLRSGATLDRMSADNARTAGYIGAGTSLLSGASKLYTGGRNSLTDWG